MNGAGRCHCEHLRPEHPTAHHEGRCTVTPVLRRQGRGCCFNACGRDVACYVSTMGHATSLRVVRAMSTCSVRGMTLVETLHATSLRWGVLRLYDGACYVSTMGHATSLRGFGRFFVRPVNGTFPYSPIFHFRFPFSPIPMISKVLQDAVDAFAQLPGVGQKTAFRFVMCLSAILTFQQQRGVEDAGKGYEL